MEKNDIADRGDWYVEFAPPPQLADCVVALWEMRIPTLPTRTRARIVPNACIDIVLYGGETPEGEGLATILAPTYRSYVVGSTLRSFIVWSSGWTHVIGASLRPEGVQPLLGLPAAVLGESMALLTDVLGAEASSFEDRVLSGPADGTLARLGQVLVERRRAADSPDPALHRAVDLVREAQGRKRIDALVADMNTSPRQLERNFLAHIGMSPKLFSRLVRFDRAVRDLAGRGTTSWAQFAVSHGYSDQAHFINEFQEFAGVSPTEFELENS